MKLSKYILLTLLCAGSIAGADGLDDALRECSSTSASSKELAKTLKAAGWSKANSKKLDELALAMALTAYPKDGPKGAALLDWLAREQKNYGEIIAKIQIGKETPFDEIDAVFMSAPDGVVAEFSFLKTEFSSGPKLYKSCRVFLQPGVSKAKAAEQIKHAFASPYLEQSKRTYNSNVSVEEWTDFDGTSAYLYHLQDLPASGTETLALNTVYRVDLKND